MGDAEYEKEYAERKKRLRKLHSRLKETKDIQEIYHKIMGSVENEDSAESSEED